MLRLCNRLSAAPASVAVALLLLVASSIRPFSNARPPQLSSYALGSSYVLSDVGTDLSSVAVVSTVGSKSTRLILSVNDAWAPVDYPQAVAEHVPTLREYELAPGSREPRLLRVVALLGFFMEDAEGITVISPQAGESDDPSTLTVAFAQEQLCGSYSPPDHACGTLQVAELPFLSSSSSSSHNVSILNITSAMRTRRYKIDDKLRRRNKGIEGVTYDARDGNFYCVLEKLPMRVVSVALGSGAVSDLFDAEQLLGGIISDIAGIHFDALSRTLFLLSQESAMIVQVTLSGEVLGTLSIAVADAPRAEPEGIAFSADMQTLYIAAEPNHLFVYDRL